MRKWALSEQAAWLMFRRWAEGTLQSVLGAVIIALVPGAAVTYLARIRSAWTGPMLLGMAAAALAVFMVLAIDAIKRLPPRRTIPNLKNIETCVRDWLNDFQCSVRKAPAETTYFRYLVTMDSGTKLLVGRVKGDLQDYVQIRAELVPGPEDLCKFEQLTELEKAVVLGNMRLELARRNVGYRDLAIPASDPNIFKRVPIRETLTAHEFIAALEEVEAAAHAVGIVFALELVKTGKFTGEAQNQIEADPSMR